jgi:hypothetical protein
MMSRHALGLDLHRNDRFPYGMAPPLLVREVDVEVVVVALRFFALRQPASSTAAFVMTFLSSSGQIVSSTGVVVALHFSSLALTEWSILLGDGRTTQHIS